MSKYSSRKNYKSTTFVPAKRRVRIKAVNYQDLVASTLKEKLPVFIVGIGVLLGLITGASLLVLKSNSSRTMAVNVPQQVTPSVKRIVIPTETLKPTVSEDKPRIDPTKAAQAAAAKPGTSSTTYVVKKGDTLWKIAEKTYKSGFNYKDVMAYN
ncbi:MAG: LysM peptidoglycan-binding domain-containing protein, partial [Patescibacteria group bacterium]